MITNALWNIILGIIGGIISSVIVSRVFLLQAELQSNVDSLEAGFRKINYLRSMIQIIKLVMQADYDTELDKRTQMELHKYKSEAEYYASKKNARWIDAVELQKKLNTRAKEEAEKVFDELRNLCLKDQQAQEILCTYIEYTNKINSMQEVPFSLVDETERIHSKAVKQLEEYKQSLKNQLFKLIVTDRVMHGLVIIIVLIIAATIFFKRFGL